MSKLHIADGLDLPIDFVTQTQAILAKKGSGKSYCASVQAEELLKAGQQIIVIDFTGVWWGLRSSVSGKEKGFPILVLGGDHGDVPLEEKAGSVIAEAIVKDRFSAVLDLSLFGKGAMNRFLAAFLETLYQKNRQPVHLFADEADAYVPQTPYGDEARTHGAMDSIVRRGRVRGIGCTLITQRPAAIAKNVLTQCDIMTCLRMSHPRDIKAVQEWIDVHAEPSQAKRMVEDLPTLPIGNAWVWAPAWPTASGIFKRVQIRQRATFDSGATPKAGESRRTAKVLAEVDVAKLGDSIRQTVEKQQADDPQRLRAEIDRLKKELAQRPEAEVRPIEVPVLAPELISAFDSFLKGMADRERELNGISEYLKLIVDRVRDGQNAMAQRQVATKATVHQQVKRATPKPSTNSSGKALPKGEKIILAIAAQYPDGISRESLTVMSSYKRSSRDAYIQRLKESGYVEINNQLVFATQEGIDALGSDYEPLPTGEALQAHWLQKLPSGESVILAALIEVWPNSMTREEIDAATDYKRSSRDAYIQRLKSRMLVEVNGREITATNVLFES